MPQIITNLSNSPYQLHLAGGKREILPAGGKLGPIEIDPAYMGYYRVVSYFQIEETGGSVKVRAEPTPETVEPESKEPVSDTAELRAKYEELYGKRAFRGWNAEELQKRIDEFKPE